MPKLTADNVLELLKIVEPKGELRKGKEKMLESVVQDGAKETTTARRAAKTALLIQSHQLFTNGNTRTATAAMYCIPMFERDQYIRAKAYQAYAMVGYWGPLYGDNPPLVITQLSSWIQSRLIGDPNAYTKWEKLLAELSDIDKIVGEITKATKTPENRNDPKVRTLLSQKKSWKKHHGYF